jgi:anti-sigma regulatory factor (Ser/Thr protein kinase)
VTAFAVVSPDLESGALILALRGTLNLRALARTWLALGRCLAHFPPALIIDLARVKIVDVIPAVLLPEVIRRGARVPGLAVLVHGAGALVAARISRGRRPGVILVLGREQALAAARSLPPHPHAKRAHARLAPTPQAPARARKLVEEACRDWAVPNLSVDAQLIVSELVSNAVEHARTDIDVTVRYHRSQLRLGVGDRDVARPRPAHRAVTGSGPASSGLAVRGRGLAMVAARARRWGTISGPDGKIVWAALSTAERRA